VGFAFQAVVDEPLDKISIVILNPERIWIRGAYFMSFKIRFDSIDMSEE